MVIDVSKKNKSYIVGEINFTDSLDEAKIESSGNYVRLSKIGKCSVQVNGGEGAIPHMHIDSTDGDFKACVCLHVNKYFSHNEVKYKQFHSQKQLNEFDAWLRSPNIKRSNGLTNYQVAVDLWVSGGNPVKFDMSKQPDYTKMHEEIQSGK